MATEKQIAANKRNAARSTGPRTPEGKARSRMNALSHGLSYIRISNFSDADDLLETMFDDLHQLRLKRREMMARINVLLATEDLEGAHRTIRQMAALVRVEARIYAARLRASKLGSFCKKG